MDILVETPPRHRKTFSLLTFTWIVFVFFCFFLLFNKRILLLILLFQTQQFRVLLFIVKNFICRRPCIWGGKLSSYLWWLLIIRPVALKCGSTRELVISATLNSVQQTTTCVPCVNWRSWWERTALCKPAGHMAA